jgi:hypothetical protein
MFFDTPSYFTYIFITYTAVNQLFANRLLLLLLLLFRYSSHSITVQILLRLHLWAEGTVSSLGIQRWSLWLNFYSIRDPPKYFIL